MSRVEKGKAEKSVLLFFVAEFPKRCSALWLTILLCKVLCVTPWFRLMRRRGCGQMRQAPVLWQKDARMGVAVDGLCPPSADLRRNQRCTFPPSCRSSVFLKATACQEGWYRPALSLFAKVFLAFSCKLPKVAHSRNFLLTWLDFCGNLSQQLNITYFYIFVQTLRG